MNLISKSYLELEKTTSYLGESQPVIIEAYIDYVESLIEKFGTISSLSILENLCMKNDPSGYLLQNVLRVAEKLVSNIISEIELEKHRNERKR